MSPISRFALALLVATTVSSAVLPSNGLILSPDSILRNLDPYTAPTQKLTTILAIGDSYTAGEGANGVRDYIKSSGNCNRYKASWPLKLAADPAWNDFNGGQPDLVFGACAGAKMGGLVERQLEQGKPDGGREYTRIGKPEIGVMMIGGNDAGFFDAINDCILHIVLPGSCTTTLSTISTRLSSPTFATTLKSTLTRVLLAGRTAAGAEPPTAFQLYVSGYVPLFNTADPGCSAVSFNFYGFSTPELTIPLRLALNSLVEQFNAVLEGVVAELSPWGVFYVSGWQDAFIGHRFCEPDVLQYLEEPVGTKTWLWHALSTDVGKYGVFGDERNTNISAEVLDMLVPDPWMRAAVREEDEGPWKYHPSLLSWEGLARALAEAEVERGGKVEREELGEMEQNGVRQLAMQVARMFHPKGLGYEPLAKAFLEAVRRNRGQVA